MKTKKVTVMGLALALAMILSFVESQIPAFVAIPGVKMGLANIAVVFALYKLGWKNQKTYDPDKVAAATGYQVKHDAAGDFIWETVPAYTIEDDFVFGHGEKSVYLASKFIVLSDEEAQAIRFHMGAWQDGDKANAGKAFALNPLAFFLHVADEAATYLDEQ